MRTVGCCLLFIARQHAGSAMLICHSTVCLSVRPFVRQVVSKGMRLGLIIKLLEF